MSDAIVCERLNEYEDRIKELKEELRLALN